MQRVRIRFLLSVIGATTLVGLSATILLFSYSGLRADRMLDAIVTVHEPLLSGLREMHAQGLQTEQATRNIILNPTDTTAMENYGKADGKFRKALTEASRLAGPGAASRLRQIGPLWDEADSLKREAQSLAVGGRSSEAVALLNGRETPKWREIKDIVLALADECAAASKAEIAAGRTDGERAYWTALAAAGLSLAVVAILLLLAGRSISRPLGGIRDFARRVAEGDYSARLDGAAESKIGEIRDTARDVERLTAEMKHAIGFHKGVIAGMATPYAVVDQDDKLVLLNGSLIALIGAEGLPERFIGQGAAVFFYGEERKTVMREAMDAGEPVVREVWITDRKGARKRVRIDASPLKNAVTGQLMGALCVCADLTELKASEARVVEQHRRLAEATERAGMVSDSLAAGTRDLSAGIREVEESVSIQQELAGMTSSVMGDMNREVLDVARNAGSAAESADEARRKAQAGAAVVQQVIGSISLVRDEARSLSESMHSLGRQAESIGRIIQVIDDIADQTNLLALNAAIEAARAGDAGRGFAVVADEVRKLAEKTMTATREVGQAIAAIQGAASDSASSVEGAAKAVEEATSLAAASGQALSGIVGMVEVASDQIRSIASASEAQAGTSQAMNTAVAEMSAIAGRIAESMRGSAKAVSSLAGQVDELGSMMEAMRG